MKSVMIAVLAVVCALSLFLHQVSARPGYDASAISGKERQELAKYAAKMLQILLHGSDAALMPAQKRNSGMLDAVINMPDLFNAGKK